MSSVSSIGQTFGSSPAQPAEPDADFMETAPDLPVEAEVSTLEAYLVAEKEANAAALEHQINDVDVRNKFIHQHVAAEKDSLKGLFAGAEALTGEDAASFMPVTFGF